MESWIGSVRKSAGVDEERVPRRDPRPAGAGRCRGHARRRRGRRRGHGARGDARAARARPSATSCGRSVTPRASSSSRGPRPSRQVVEQMQLHYAVRSLSDLGFERLAAGSQVGAVAFARGAQSIQKKAGAPLVLLGMAAAKLEKFQDAIEAFRAGFKDGVPAPAKGRLAMRGNAHYGYVLLKSEGKAPAAGGREGPGARGGPRGARREGRTPRSRRARTSRGPTCGSARRTRPSRRSRRRSRWGR